MFKQSKLSKICWAFVYLFPLIYGAFCVLLALSPDGQFQYALIDVFDGDVPFITINFFNSQPLLGLIGDSAYFADKYLGYLVLVSLFRIVWRVLVYLPDVIGKLIDRWSL